MPLSIGVNLRVTGHCNQGGRKYMEDMFSVAYQQSSNDRELEYAFFGIFDGHGGGEAAAFAKENLMDTIVKQKNFWSDKDEDVLRAIRDGYINTHYAMWRELEKWPKTSSGLPSTAGTTASIAFIRKGKIYIGHVGDSAIILGYQESSDLSWKAKALTTDHKPECGIERTRIHESGGKVINKSGVPRVVWNRPRIGHKGPVRRSTHIDEIPFLAVARSLGDLWSYNSELNTFVVSPEPDVKVITIDIKSYRCLIFGTDGLWNMLTPQMAVSIVQAAERHNEKHLIASHQTGNGQSDGQMWINPSKSLVDHALERWISTKLRADNTSVVTLMLDPPGPAHTDILLTRSMVPSVNNNSTPLTSEKATSSKNNDFESNDNYNEIQKTNSTGSPFRNSVTNEFLNPQLHESDPFKNNRHSIYQEKYFDIRNHTSKNSDNGNNYLKHNDIESMVTNKLNRDLDRKNCDEPKKRCNSSTDHKVDENNTKYSQNSVDFHSERQNQQGILDTDSLSSDISSIDNNLVIKNQLLTNKTSNAIRRKSKTISCSEVHSSGYSNTIHQGSRKTRRHSTGTPQQKSKNHQRRSLTPKSLPNDKSLNFATSSKLKMNAKVLHDKKIEKSTSKAIIGLESEMNNGNLNSEYKKQSFANELTNRCNLIEPRPKKRTRSEDRIDPIDENDPAIQKLTDDRMERRWSVGGTSKSCSSKNPSSIQERRLSSPNSFKKRNLGKKVTPMKSMRRSSLNKTNRMQIRENITLKDWEGNRMKCRGQTLTNRRQTVANILNSTTSDLISPKRWLRSDTVAAIPTKTLRSRNVEIINQVNSIHISQYTKSNQESLSAKSKPNSALLTSSIHSSVVKIQTPTSFKSSSGRIKPSNCSKSQSTSSSSMSSIISGSNSNNSGISKRVMSPYNLSSRSLTTRSRIKRFSK